MPLTMAERMKMLPGAGESSGHPVNHICLALPGDEGNVTKTTVVKLLPGCYLWLASLVLLPLAALLQKFS